MQEILAKIMYGYMKVGIGAQLLIFAIMPGKIILYQDTKENIFMFGLI